MTPREEALRAALTAKRGFPYERDPINRTLLWQSDPNGAYVGFEDAWDVVLAATPEPSVSVEAAWEALTMHDKMTAAMALLITEHRPAIEAALRASVTPLDVERLARAVHTWRYGDKPWKDGGEDERGSTYIAEHIAAEYARLTEDHDA